MTNTSVKVWALTTCLGALTGMVGLTGCAGDRYHQSTDRHIDDNRTTEAGSHQTTDQAIEDRRTAERVREALAAGADYKYDGVKVTADDGLVQLSGVVNTSAQRNSAGEVTSKVVGVKSLQNNLSARD